MKLQAWKRLVLALAVALLLVSLSGCFDTPEGQWLAWAFFGEWQDENDLNPAKPDGSVNPEGVANLGKRALTGSTGDEESDAALDYGWIGDIAEADEMMDEARKDRDPEKMAEAIKKRPNDYTYRASAAVLAAERGNAPGWNVQEDAGEQLAGKPGDQVRYADQLISEAEAAVARITNNGARPYKDPVQCELLYRTLSSAYGLRYRAKGSVTASDLDLSNKYYYDSKDGCYSK